MGISQFLLSNLSVREVGNFNIKVMLSKKIQGLFQDVIATMGMVYPSLSIFQPLNNKQTIIGFQIWKNEYKNPIKLTFSCK